MDADKTAGKAFLTFMLSSSVFMEGGVIPDDYGEALQAYGCSAHKSSAEGQSPPLSWKNAPSQTRSFVLIMSDTAKPSVAHWVLWDIPTTASSLVDFATVNTNALPMGSKQHGVSDRHDGSEATPRSSERFYVGPCPDDQGAAKLNAIPFAGGVGVAAGGEAAIRQFFLKDKKRNTYAR